MDLGWGLNVHIMYSNLSLCWDAVWSVVSVVCSDTP